jgi:transcriptional regulator with XRE-family HTH domain
MTTLGEKLTALRERKGWTKTFVAKKLGIKTLSTYANYEYGIREPDMETLGRIADIYDISLDELLGRSVDNTRTIHGSEVDTSDLSDNQRLVLDWAMKQEALSFHSEDELKKILDDMAVIFEYERRKKGRE